MSYADKLVRRAELRRKMGDKLKGALDDEAHKEVARHSAQHMLMRVRWARWSA